MNPDQKPNIELGRCVLTIVAITAFIFGICSLTPSRSAATPYASSTPAAIVDASPTCGLPPLGASAEPDAFAKGRCELNAKADDQLDRVAKVVAAANTEIDVPDKAEAAKPTAPAEKETRDPAQAVDQPADDQKGNSHDALAEAKRQREEAIAHEKRYQMALKKEKREAAEATRIRLKKIRDGIRDGSIRPLKASRLSDKTHKWDGKNIVATLSCFYAAAGEYRCVRGHVRADFSYFEPEAAEEGFKANCDTIAKSQRRSCSLKILFKYVGFNETVIGAGPLRVKITVVQPQFKSGEILSR